VGRTAESIPMQIWTMPKLKTVLDEANAMRGNAQLTGGLLGMRISTNPYSSAKDDLHTVAEAFPGFRALRAIIRARNRQPQRRGIRAR
jgi:hypothetical protein